MKLTNAKTVRFNVAIHTRPSVRDVFPEMRAHAHGRGVCQL